MKKNMIFVLTIVAAVLAPCAFADEAIEGGGELQRVEEPESEQSTQETAGTEGEGSESEAIDEPVSDNADTSPIEV